LGKSIDHVTSSLQISPGVGFGGGGVKEEGGGGGEARGRSGWWRRSPS
jgi:hypothetical protein